MAPPIFSPGAAPRQKPATRRSLSSLRCCLMSIGAVTVVVVAILLTHSLVMFYRGAKSGLAPHSDLVHQPSISHPVDERDVVRPLIDQTALFDMEATVWLDVTEHIQRGRGLPPGITVVTYSSPAGGQRSEAIVYNDKVFEKINMTSYTHTSAKIRLPIDPLYSQPLGPSTLRATFQVIPRDEPTGLTLQTYKSIYPDSMAIGPRSPQSPLLRNEPSLASPSLSDALERSSISIPLIDLQYSQWRHNATSPNLVTHSHSFAPFFDGYSNNRKFLNGSTGDHAEPAFIVDQDHRIMIPHVHTRSRVMMLKEDRNFSRVLYTNGSAIAALDFLQECLSHLNDSHHQGISCNRLVKESIFENSLYFGKQTSDMTSGEQQEEQIFYAPFLAQQASASSPRHLRTIPHHHPGITAGRQIDRDKSEDEVCLIPLLRTDEEQEFFEFDWDIVFSAHGRFRIAMAEESYWSNDLTDLGTLKDYDGEDLRIMTNALHHWMWFMQGFQVGDRERPDSRPYWKLFGLMFKEVALSLAYIFDFIYWYTRRTTYGLSGRAQWALVAMLPAELFALLIRPDPKAWYLFNFFLAALFASIGVLQITTLIRLERSGWLRYSRRRPNWKERGTYRLDCAISWPIVIALCMVVNLFYRISVGHAVKILPSSGCYPSDKALDVKTSAIKWDVSSQWTASLSVSSTILQIIFNARSRAFAGSFKFAAVMRCACSIIGFLIENMHISHVWGADRPPLMLIGAVEGILQAVFAYQALTLPGIPQHSSNIEGDLDDDDL